MNKIVRVSLFTYCCHSESPIYRGEESIRFSMSEILQSPAKAGFLQNDNTFNSLSIV